jgi:hypothetical protein
MDLLVLPLLLFVLGTGNSVVSKPFRTYWIFVLVFATMGAALFQIAVFLQLGFLDPFYRAAFVSSWLILYALGTLAFVAYRAVQRARGKTHGENIKA